MTNRVNVGDQAPHFTLLDVDMKPRSLLEFLRQKVVLVFFLGAFTSTCTKEVCDFRDSMAQLINLKAQIVGIDINIPILNKNIAEKNKIPFPLLSDNKREVLEAYGLKPELLGNVDESNACCWGPGCYPIAKRAIFILDENGVVRYTWVSNDRTVEPNYGEIQKVLKEPVPEEQFAKVPRTVITISRQVGSGGDEIALKVCKTLGYACFDKNLMLSVAKSMGFPEEKIADFSEDTYKVKSLVDRILLRRKPVAVSLSLKDNSQIRTVLDEEECLSAIQIVINNLASRGETVIVGRGGQAILKDKVGVLHVRIVAPTAVRVERIMKSERLSQEDATKLIEVNDKAAAEYLRRFYNIDWEEPAIYDIVLNTGKIDLSTAARVIASVGHSW